MKKKHLLIIFIPILIIFFSSLTWIFLRFQTEKFWEANFYEIITVFLTALLGVLGFAITIFMVTNVEEKRRYVDSVALILDKLDEILTTDELIPRIIEQSKPEYKKMMSSKRNVTNYIEILQKNSEKLRIKDEINFILDRFHEYEIRIDTCCRSKTKEISNDVCVELSNLLSLIQSKICEVRISIYNSK